MRAVVGGRSFDFTKEDIERRMSSVHPEPIREHLVEMLGTVFPPKQVLATVTGWDRTSFTTMEAQRVLTRVGFVCRRASQDGEGRLGWMAIQPPEELDPEAEASRLPGGTSAEHMPAAEQPTAGQAISKPVLDQRWPFRDGEVALVVTIDRPLSAEDFSAIGKVAGEIERLVAGLAGGDAGA